jgi:hypothetical protein
MIEDPTKPKKPSANPFEQGYQATATTTTDNPFEQGFQAAASTPDAAPEPAKSPEPTTDVGHVEGLTRAGMQGLTLGFGDELEALLSTPQAVGMTGRNPIDVYKELRDIERNKQKSYSAANPGKAAIAEALGSLPTAVLGGPAGGIRAGAEFGAASALGHGEG